MQVKIVIGTVAFMLTMIIFGYAALREPERLNDFTLAAEGRRIENGASLFAANCAACHGVEAKAEVCLDPSSGEQVACRGIPLNNVALVCGDRPARLDTMGWTGSKRNFVYQTISSGRGAVMPTWSVTFGGPLRDDQVLDVAAYVLNFESEELCSGSPATVGFTFSDSVDDLLTEFGGGDAARGEELYTVTYGCAACHGALSDSNWAGVGPGLGAIAENAPNRISDISIEQYIYESVLTPSSFVVDEYPDGVMPANFGDRMGETVESPQDLADIIAYLTGN